MNRKQYGFTPGVASLIMVLVTLAMVVFSTLYLVQANSNLKMTRRYLANSVQYYEADSEVMDIFYALNEELYMANSIDEVRDIVKNYGMNDKSGIINGIQEFGECQSLVYEFEIKYDEHYYAIINKWQKCVDYEADYESNNFDF